MALSVKRKPHLFSAHRNLAFGSRKPEHTMGELLLEILFLGLAAWFFMQAFQCYRVHLAERNWLSVDATVTAGDLQYSPGSHKHRASWAPVWRYSFSVGSLPYNSASNAVEYAYVLHSDSFQSAASRDLDQHPVGSTVTAWYDPENPARSTLERTDGPPFFELLGGVILLFVAFVRTGPS